MKFTSFSAIKATLASTFLVVSTVAMAAGTASSGNKDILSVAKQAGSFNTLAKAIEAAGLTEALSGQGPITVFAPTDEAFAKLPAGELEALLKPENKDKLVKVLTYHVVSGKALEQYEMKRSRGAKSLQGSDLKFALVRGKLRVDDARVTTDLNASNGVIHAVDRVLIPN